MKTVFNRYIISKNKIDNIMTYLSSEDTDVVMVGAGLMKELFGINENIIRTSVSQIRIGDKITFTSKNEEDKNYLDTGKVKSIGKNNIVVEKNNSSTSFYKENLKEDAHFSIITQ